VLQERGSCKIKKGCLSEEIFEVVSNEEFHYKRSSFDGKAIQQLPDQNDKNTQFCRTLLQEMSSTKLGVFENNEKKSENPIIQLIP